MPSEEEIVYAKIGEERATLIFENARGAWQEKGWRETREDFYTYCKRMIGVSIGGYRQYEELYLRLLLKRFRRDSIDSTEFSIVNYVKSLK